MEKEFIKYFKVISCINIVVFIVGFLLNQDYIYLGASTGILISIINNYILMRSVVKIAYEYKGVMYFFIQYIIRYIIYIISFIFILYISNKFNLKNVKLSLIFQAFGMMSFKFLIYFEKYICKKGGRNEKNKRK